MKVGTKLIIIGVVLAAATGVLMLVPAIATGPRLQSVFPGLLVLAFAAAGGWGGAAPTLKQKLRALLGASLGGLVIAGLYFVPAALVFVVAAVVSWRSK